MGNWEMTASGTTPLISHEDRSNALDGWDTSGSLVVTGPTPRCFFFKPAPAEELGAETSEAVAVHPALRWPLFQIRCKDDSVDRRRPDRAEHYQHTEGDSCESLCEQKRTQYTTQTFQ